MSNVVNVSQGTPEWLQHRAAHYNASDAPAMLGVSSYKTRGDLLREKATGHTPEIDPGTQRRFDDGHEYEAIALPWAEEIIGDELFPVVLADEIDGLPLSASLDGLTMAGTVAFEHKTLNKALAESLDQNIIPDEYRPQMEQQLLLSGAERCLFMASNGDRDTMRYAWYETDPEQRKRVLNGWHQFQDDVANYTPPEEESTAVGLAPESLPAIRIELEGRVTASNLAEFKQCALTAIDSVNTDLQTDKDFVDAEATVKWFKEAEDRLDAAKQHALSQTADIDALFRTIDDIKESARQKRLELDKRVKERKQSIRGEIRQEAENALADHMHHLYERLDNRAPIPAPKADFAAAMKNKRTISSLRDAVDQVLADAKIEASAIADTIQANLKTFDEIAADYTSLFPDLGQIAHKAPDDFQAAVKLRIADHKEKEEKRLEAEREKIRAEEQQKAEAKVEEQAKDSDPLPPDFPPAEEQTEPAGEPRPATSGTPTVQWTITCTFHTETGPLATSQALETRVRKLLADGGIDTVESVTCEKKRRVA